MIMIHLEEDQEDQDQETEDQDQETENQDQEDQVQEIVIDPENQEDQEKKDILI